MTRLEGGVGMATGCCGAPALWSGREPLYEQTTDALKEQWRSLGRPRLISACPTCLFVTLRQGFPETEVVSLWEVLQGLGLPIPFPAGTAKSWRSTIRAPPGVIGGCRMPPATS